MKTGHEIHLKDSREMSEVPDRTADLVVTSPPYPMIEMWDPLFVRQDRNIEDAIKKGDGFGAFELMHRLLDPVWDRVARILRPGGFACINIGDATRTIGGRFSLYSNHARIVSSFVKAGLVPLPIILWRKQTNAPNKFMGSGMLPAGAYVTLEHEYILIFRKGDKREFSAPELRERRRESAIFWEERNTWFSDVWFDLKGERQIVKDAERKRSGAFPFELAYRLINMYSVKGDLVVDPFMGAGTTLLAAMAAARNSMGFELEPGFAEITAAKTESLVPFAGKYIDARLRRHLDFVEQRLKQGKPLKHTNLHYNFPVVTSQETGLVLSRPLSVSGSSKHGFYVEYSSDPCVHAESQLSLFD
ncbi:MAG: site-specific DNA-methyltransferase [Desulfobacteraceae bacterium]